MVRVDETPLHDAVREALVNCLVNTDFYEPRGVVIEKYPDRIEFRNLGTSIVGKKQMLRGGESEPRNGSIMKVFNLKYITVVYDIDRNRVIWIHEGRSEEVFSLFCEELTEEERNAMEIVAGDGAQWIDACKNKYFPQRNSLR